MDWNTHEPSNLVTELKDYNLYTTDLALQEGVRRAGAVAHEAELTAYGALLGSEQTIRMAEEAHHFKPELHTFDRQGRRIDRVEFHPSWHSIMKIAREHDMVTRPCTDERPGAWAAYAAGFSMHHQIEAGGQCPHSMTLASVSVLRQEPELFAQLAPKLFSRSYDMRDIPLEQKSSITIGMGMTEKQGGSDLRTNTTRAVPVPGGYEIIGHKWFFSAPMCDAHLVLARTEEGLSCFFVPRYRPDGSKNPIRIQRLKEKIGNRSNASSEVEFQGAWGRLVGKEAFERGDSPLERAYQRIVTPAGKLWTAKRGIELSAEAMEVFGGNGYMDEGPMGRLYREMPLLSIWEGSGNVMALDMLRAIGREPEAMAALVADLQDGCADDARLRPCAKALPDLLRASAEQEALARRAAQALVVLIQARLLRERAPQVVADAFVATRFDDQCGRIYGTLPNTASHAAIIERAWPV